MNDIFATPAADNIAVSFIGSAVQLVAIAATMSMPACGMLYFKLSGAESPTLADYPARYA